MKPSKTPKDMLLDTWGSGGQHVQRAPMPIHIPCSLHNSFLWQFICIPCNTLHNTHHRLAPNSNIQNQKILSTDMTPEAENSIPSLHITG